MPQTVRIQHTGPGRKIEQLKAHRQNDPRDDQTRPSGPCPLQLPVSRDTEPAPEQVLYYADDDVGGHVICVVEPPEGQVGDVSQIEKHA